LSDVIGTLRPPTRKIAVLNRHHPSVINDNNIKIINKILRIHNKKLSLLLCKLLQKTDEK